MDTLRRVLLALTAITLSACAARAQASTSSSPRSPDGQPAPAYPLVLARAGVEGEVWLRAVVDSLGHAVAAQLRVVRSSHELFARAAKAAVLAWRFEPGVGMADVHITFGITDAQQCDAALAAAADPALAPHWYRYDSSTSSASVTTCVIPTEVKHAIP